MKNNFLVHRISQLVGFLLGARIFVLIFFTFTLYVSTFFLFNQEENLRKFVFDYKVHGIIFCSVLSLAAGGLINRFYDREKDKYQRPFRNQLQNFFQEKYLLYSYIILNAVSLSISAFLSWRIFVFFLVYQFFIWFYSHKISKILFLNNLTFVSLSLYPFCGLLVYYQHFSMKLLLMAVFLFLILLMVDVIKDVLTMEVDKIFKYNTIANVFGRNSTYITLVLILFLNAITALLIVAYLPHINYLSWYFILSVVFFIFMSFPILTFDKSHLFWVINFFRIWIFVGVLFMLLNGFFERFNS